MTEIELKKKLDELRELAKSSGADITSELATLERKLALPKGERGAIETVKLARLIGRPTMLDYVDRIFDTFFELHGDRVGGDDTALIGGIATLNGKAYTVFGQHRGRNFKESIYRKNGMAGPEGYRKALRLAKQAEKFGRPIIAFVDTQGAYPGVSSEERGIGEALARNQKELSLIGVPFISFFIGEGGSGGALAIAVGDEVWMLENAIYSVISPEGCASILLRDATKNEYAASVLKLTAKDLQGFGIADGVIPEPAGGAQNDPVAVAQAIKARMVKSVDALSQLSKEELISRRFQKFCEIGAYEGFPAKQDGFLRRFLMGA